MVTGRFLLFVGRLVFLIYNDQSQRLHRRKNCRPRPDHNLRASLPDLMPFIVPFAGREMTVQHGHQRLEWT